MERLTERIFLNARNALAFADEVGLTEQIEVVHRETSPTLRNEVVFARELQRWVVERCLLRFTARSGRSLGPISASRTPFSAYHP